MNKKNILKKIIILFSILILLKKNNIIFFNNIKLNNEFFYNKLPFIKHIYFNYDLYFFNNKFNNMLNQYIIYMRNNPNKKILLKIDTIGLGNIKYNLYLNKYRMNFIVNNLVLKGINKKNIKYIICVKKNKFYNEINNLNNNKIIITIS
ncbi:peptidoglycan-binding protein [Candidatus Portiera aleyrodidarum]|uniref:Peptidoglycan-binding protein n=1 Tax=Candidatus Portiera aleyrodidarum TaxID=91844 RepID=A0A6S6RWE7_9GAMM|nr:peptidoglycan-binding protein [Candidatus Portiera aleyrodidarum]CAA3707215.1 peptidoglycan-binding protein [Candidatus Portiera aleyrodidarum]